MYTFIAYKRSLTEYGDYWGSEFQIETEFSIEEAIAQSVKLLSCEFDNGEPSYEIYILWNGHKVFEHDYGWYNVIDADAECEAWYQLLDENSQRSLYCDMLMLRQIESSVKAAIDERKREKEAACQRQLVIENERNRLRELKLLSELQSKYQGKQ